MEPGEKLDSIPIDLIIEIFSRLPANSIARFRCVSKLWESMLHGPYFTELFLTRSRTRPRLLFFIEQAGELFLYSLPQPQNPYEKSSSLVVDATDQIKLIDPTCRQLYSCGYASGLICFSDVLISKEYGNKRVICNPSTGQCETLPKLIRNEMSNHIMSSDFLGLDPIDKQFKVLSMASHHDYGYSWDDHRILTLGNEKMRWRKIQCLFAHEPSTKGICINGVLYYLAQINRTSCALVCFHVRCEKFTFIFATFFNFGSTILINYKGKLGGISWVYNDVDAIELSMWVLEDLEKQEWSKYVYTLQDNKIADLCDVFVAGVTSTGQIVLSIDHASKPFYVFYFDPERSTLQTVEIHGNHQVFDTWNRVYLFVDHVEDLKFNMMKRKPISTSTSSKEDHHQKEDRRTFESNNKTPISICPPPEQKCELMSTSTSSEEDHHQQQECDSCCSLESINKFDALCLLDDDVGEAECDSSFTDHVEDLNFNIMKTTSISLQEKKRRKPTRTSKEDHRQKQDRHRFESINKVKCDFSFTGFVRALSLCWLTILLFLVIMFMS